MINSTKQRFIYGLVSLSFSFIFNGIIYILFFLIIQDVIPENYITSTIQGIILCIAGIIILIKISINNFITYGKLKEKNKQ